MTKQKLTCLISTLIVLLLASACGNHSYSGASDTVASKISETVNQNIGEDCSISDNT